MAKTTKETVTLNIPVSITKERLEKLSSRNPGLNTTELLSGVATGLLSDAADGGMMLESYYLQQIANLIGEVNLPEDIVKPIESYARRVSGQKMFTYMLDPIWEEPLRQEAEQCGRTPEQMVQEAVDLILSQTSWIYDMSDRFMRGDLYHMIVNKTQWEFLKRVLGVENVTGTAICDLLETAVVDEAAA